MSMRENCKLADCEVADKSSKKCTECLNSPPRTAITAWAIKAPQGIILYRTLMDSYDSCVHEYTRGDIALWDACTDMGFHCVGVRVVEIKE